MTEFRGCGTALVTPFTRAGALDRDALLRLVDRQLEAGVDFLVPCGTTGESVTLSDEEYREVVRLCVDRARGRKPVVAGAGTNDTRRVVELARTAEAEGADALLSVTPYYNRPSQDGLLHHYETVAKAVRIPLILYNVPGRTGVRLETKTVLRLADVPNIKGIKEASGSLDTIQDLLLRRPEGFAVLSGDDPLALATALLGGEGVISVVGNLIPAEMSRMIRLAHGGDVSAARQIHFRFLDLIHVNFVESNPIPVKYALARMGLLKPSWRSPLGPPTEESRRRIDRELSNLGLVGSG